MTDETNPQGSPAEGRELADAVGGHLRAGEPGAALRAFSRGWRDAVPELPLRFEVILVRADRDVARGLHRALLDDGKAPELHLARASEHVVQVLNADGERVGNLPAQDARLLSDLGVGIDLYRPQVLEIRYDDAGRFQYLAVMLARPEIRLCSACGEQHSTPHVNCAKCRGRRRRKGEGMFEPSPVSFHEALDAIVREGDDDSEDPLEDPNF